MIWQLIEQLPNPHHSSHRKHHTHHPSIIPQHRPKPTAHQPIHLTTQSASQPAQTTATTTGASPPTHNPITSLQPQHGPPTPTSPDPPDLAHPGNHSRSVDRANAKDASHVGGGGTLLHVSPAQTPATLVRCSCDGTCWECMPSRSRRVPCVHVHGTYCYIHTTYP